MAKKYIIELEEPEMFDDRKFYTCTQMPWWAVSENIAENLTPYTAPDLEQVRKEAYDNGYEDAEEKYNDGYSDGYDAGLIDAWEACIKIIDMDADTSEKIFGEWYTKEVVHAHTAAEAIEKLKAYEREEIKAGDEVFCVDCPDIKIWVIDAHDNKFAGIALSDVDGCCDIGDMFKEEPLKNYAKTGNHYELAAVLEKIRGEQNGKA